MKRNFMKVMGLALVVFSLASCSKNSDKKSTTELLIKAGWKYESDGVDMDKNGTIDMADVLVEDCYKDDVTVFASNGTGTVNAGSVKCDPADEQTYSFEWSLSNGDKDITYDGEAYKISSIDENKLTIYSEGDFGNGTIVRFYITLKH